MSFLLDPPALFIIGSIFYFAGNKIILKRFAKIVIGLFIVVSFIFFSILLYMDILHCIFPIVCKGSSGSEFMFHSNFTGIFKKDVHTVIVILLFALYPLWFYLGYNSASILSKRKTVS